MHCIESWDDCFAIYFVALRYILYLVGDYIASGVSSFVRMILGKLNAKIRTGVKGGRLGEIFPFQVVPYTQCNPGVEELEVENTFYYLQADKLSVTI